MQEMHKEIRIYILSIYILLQIYICYLITICMLEVEICIILLLDFGFWLYNLVLKVIIYCLFVARILIDNVQFISADKND